jgi:hypothetical protein
MLISGRDERYVNNSDLITDTQKSQLPLVTQLVVILLLELQFSFTGMELQYEALPAEQDPEVSAMTQKLVFILTRFQVFTRQM